MKAKALFTAAAATAALAMPTAAMAQDYPPVPEEPQTDTDPSDTGDEGDVASGGTDSLPNTGGGLALAAGAALAGAGVLSRRRR